MTVSIDPKMHRLFSREARLFMKTVGTQILTVEEFGDGYPAIRFTAVGSHKKSHDVIHGTFLAQLRDDGTPHHIFEAKTGRRVWRDWDQIPDASRQLELDKGVMA